MTCDAPLWSDHDSIQTTVWKLKHVELPKYCKRRFGRGGTAPTRFSSARMGVSFAKTPLVAKHVLARCEPLPPILARVSLLRRLLGRGESDSSSDLREAFVLPRRFNLGSGTNDPGLKSESESSSISRVSHDVRGVVNCRPTQWYSARRVVSCNYIRLSRI